MYSVSLVASVGGLLYGYSIGNVPQILNLDAFGLAFGYKFVNGSTVQPCLNEDQAISCEFAMSDITGWIAFSFLLGAVLSSALSSVLCDCIGRKWSILVAAVLYAVGSGMHLVLPNITAFFCGRAFLGFAVGIFTVVVPMYLSEISPVSIRGSITAMFNAMMAIGLLMSSVVNAAIILSLGVRSDDIWHLSFVVQTLPAVLLCIAIPFLPYSPRWLANIGREDLAMNSLAQLRRQPLHSDSIRNEFNELNSHQIQVTTIEQAEDMHWRDLLKVGIIYRLFIVIVLQFFQVATGANAILFYETTLYQSLGFSETGKQLATVLMNGMDVLGAIPAVFLIERVGRKALLVYGSVMMLICHVFITAFGLNSTANLVFGWLAVAFIAIFYISYNLSWGPIVWTYQSEIFPYTVKSKAIAIGTVANWGFNAVFAKLQPILIDDIGFWTFAMYAGFCLLMGIFCACRIIETRNKTLDEIDELFKASSGGR